MNKTTITAALLAALIPAISSGMYLKIEVSPKIGKPCHKAFDAFIRATSDNVVYLKDSTQWDIAEPTEEQIKEGLTVLTSLNYVKTSHNGFNIKRSAKCIMYSGTVLEVSASSPFRTLALLESQEGIVSVNMINGSDQVKRIYPHLSYAVSDQDHERVIFLIERLSDDFGVSKEDIIKEAKGMAERSSDIFILIKRAAIVAKFLK